MMSLSIVFLRTAKHLKFFFDELLLATEVKNLKGNLQTDIGCQWFGVITIVSLLSDKCSGIVLNWMFFETVF